ncbi:MAG: CpaD family pilus assembly protein [Xanthobacteraceae bacterium]
MSATTIPEARRRATLAVRAVAIAACTAMLAGCYTARDTTLENIPNDYRQRHPIALKEGPRTIELFIGNRRGTLTAVQRAEVLAFARAWQHEATGGILIDVPNGTSNEGAATSASREIRSILAGAGVPPRAMEVRPHRTHDPRKLATLRLHYPTVVAEAGPCGLWPYDLGPTYNREHYENRQYYNFGCSTQRNLAAMVDQPTDLVQPRAEIPVYTKRRATVFEKYSKGDSTATKHSDAGKGKISELGQ